MEEDDSHSRHNILGAAVARRKHEEMLERLSIRCSLRRSDTDSSTAFESKAAFTARFSELKNCIDSVFSRWQRLDVSDSKSQPKSDLDGVSVSIAELEKLVAEKSYFLPSYELRSSLRTITELKQKLESLNSVLIPKKKFSFRNKNPKKEQMDVRKEPQVGNSVSDGVNFKIPEPPGFKNQSNAVLVRDLRSSNLEFGEFSISDLDNCEVHLVGSIRALFIHRVRDCRVYAGPVLGSILVEEAEGCVFVFASHQTRIHLVRHSDFYLRVRSRPIIEDCSEVRFAPYNLYYDGVEQDLGASGLTEETGSWKDVDDFKWLRAVPSPNWSVIPENERIHPVTLSYPLPANDL